MYKKVSLVFILVCFFISSTEQKKLTIPENLAIGAISGTTEVFANHWTEFIKSQYQEPDKFKWPKLTGTKLQQAKLFTETLYRGVGACAVSYVPGYAAQFLISEKLKELLLDTSNQNSNKFKGIPIDFLAGALSAGIITPSQVITIYQQNANKKLLESCKEIYAQGKIKNFYRGFIPTALRWGGFAGIYLSGSDIIKDKLKELNDEDKGINWCKDLGYSIGAGIPAGILATIVTHPFDVVKTKIQLDCKATKYKNLQEVINEIYKENGFSGFTKGWRPRSFRVISAIIILNSINKSLKCNLLKYKEQDEI